MKPSAGFILLLHSFEYAAKGIALTFSRPRNAWIAALAALAVTGAGVWLGISRTEWCMVALAYAGVWAAEALNTALELLAARSRLNGIP